MRTRPIILRVVLRAMLLVVLSQASAGCRGETPQATADRATAKKPSSAPAPPRVGTPWCIDGLPSGDSSSVGTLSIEGSATEAVESLTHAELDEAICPHLLDAKSCLRPLVEQEKLADPFEATLAAKLVVGPDGSVKALLQDGTLKDEAMRACVRDALLAATLPHGPGEGTYAVRICVKRKLQPR